MISHYYLIEVQYLGFRYHGWQRQPDVKTIQEMIERTLNYVLKETPFKILGASRTDAMVSSNHSAFELFLHDPIDAEQLFLDFNENLPADIRALSIEEVDAKFNIIQSPKVKEYVYLFSVESKNHPFAAPFITYIREQLDLDLMKKGAQLFEGNHNFKEYCYKPSEKTVFQRDIMLSEIVKNDVLTANFFPDTSYVLRVKGKGFMRNQIRLMMGRLIRLGRGETSLDEIEKSLESPVSNPEYFIAPASGLMLYNIKIEK
jgi:tRNA pseudouridine38-40 synthase